MKRITISDVAKHADVSKSTISQYLNKRYDYMAPKTKERISKAIEELGYQPNIVARSLKQKSTSTIGVIVANILHTFSTQTLRAVEDICNEQGFHVIVCNADDNPEKEREYIEMLRAKQVDGLIIFPTGGNMELYQMMVKEKYPLVFVDRIVDDLNISSIMLNNESAIKMAVDHFVEKGYSSIGIMTASIERHVTPRVERIHGYKKALREKGVPIRDEYIKSLEMEHIQDGLHEMLSLDKPPRALIAGNDLTLIEILRYIKARKIRVPEDLALIGIDDVSFASLFTPELTTIAQPTFDMGKQAAELLLNKIKNQDFTEEETIYRFEPELIVRNSS
ncbi:LacI family DNA-binding transcriptional regulator [Rossellomorea vietnamensis]|uniref:LacI family DNA-binding transcriptional regulator n=1 Tax=Rossellomorea vietnamensis TaxID=218284 RepID=A0A5D4M4L6_9BACI|nr:substrate-binding domain-containing protein [Rossellomorea vietnamensis]TYR96263.1 LacI family DNA-binding transcriptional regulator [Rossellomorea vietnamensis]